MADVIERNGCSFIFFYFSLFFFIFFYYFAFVLYICVICGGLFGGVGYPGALTRGICALLVGNGLRRCIISHGIVGFFRWSLLLLRIANALNRVR